MLSTGRTRVFLRPQPVSWLAPPADDFATEVGTQRRSTRATNAPARKSPNILGTPQGALTSKVVGFGCALSRKSSRLGMISILGRIFRGDLHSHNGYPTLSPVMPRPRGDEEHDALDLSFSTSSDHRQFLAWSSDGLRFRSCHLTLLQTRNKSQPPTSKKVVSIYYPTAL